MLQGSTTWARDKQPDAFQQLRTPWHESFAFTSVARKNISDAIVARIRELNSADIELYELGKTLLSAAVKGQKMKGTWETIQDVQSKSRNAVERLQGDGDAVDGTPHGDGSNKNSLHDEL